MESGERPRTAACNLTTSRGRCIFKEMRGYPRPRLTSFRPPREPARTRSAHRGMRRGYFPRTASRRPHRPPRTSRAAAAMRRARASSGPLTWLAAADSRRSPQATSPGRSACVSLRVQPSRPWPAGQRRAGPAAANRRQRARPARLRAAASTEARVRRAEGAGKAKLALKGGRRTRPGAAAPRSFSRISGPHRRDDHFTSAADNGGRSPGIDPNAPPGLLGLVVPRGALPACAEAPPGIASQVPRT